MAIGGFDNIGKKMTSMQWFDVDPAKQTANECILFAKKLIAALASDDLTEVKTKDKGQLLAYLAKAMDQISRLIQFSQGEADSRQEITLAQLLPHLQEDELAIFDRALERLATQEAGGAGEPSLKH